MVAGRVTGNGHLVSGLGGPTGYGDIVVPRNDDGYFLVSDISSVFEHGLNFFGHTYTSLYVNTNGSISFGQGISTYTPTTITGGLTPMIAPFWGDVDTRTPASNGAQSEAIYVNFNTAADVMTVTWPGVNYYNQHGDLQNFFQLQLYDRGNGRFEIVFRYQDIQWATGDASGGHGGLGGAWAHAGFTAGDGQHFYELPQSTSQDAILGLEQVAGNTGTTGLWDFNVQSGNGVINGSPDNDTIYGGTGTDTIVGGIGADTLYGGDGNDNLYGGTQDDTLYGGAGNDLLVGGTGNNTMYGGDGNDVISELDVGALSGNDTIDGGNGIDIIYAAAGDDIVFGGTDAANNYADLGDGNDTYTGANGTDVVLGGLGNDTIAGGLGDDSLYGGDGNDILYGGIVNSTAAGTGNALEGIDVLVGGAGDDQLYGGGGNDLLVGGDGNDILYGQAGIDILYGGAGNDILNGGPGVDALYGGAGNDTFQVGGRGYGYDYIWDFESGPTGHDILELQAGHFGSVAAVRAASSFSSGNTTINAGGGDVVVLVGFNLATVADQYIHVNGAF